MKRTWNDRLREDMRAQGIDEEASVQFVLRDLERFGLRRIAEEVAQAYNVTLCEMLGPTHEAAPSHARHVLWAVLYGKGRTAEMQPVRAVNPAIRVQYTRKWSYPALARMFRRDHSSIIHGVRKVTPAEIETFGERLRSERAEAG
jgi:chromosomal replication initiation ATPase DnaA